MMGKDLLQVDLEGWFVHEVDGYNEYIGLIKRVCLEREGVNVEQARVFVRRVGLKSEQGLSSRPKDEDDLNVRNWTTEGRWRATIATNIGWCYDSSVEQIPNELGYRISRGQFGQFLLFPPKRYPELQRLCSSPKSPFESKLIRKFQLREGVVTFTPNSEARVLLGQYNKKDRENLTLELGTALARSLRSGAK